MESQTSNFSAHCEWVRRYPLLEALRNRRSRRFGLGMEIPEGPLAYRSRFQPRAISEDEEAMLAYAACGITGWALADLCYAPGQGGNIMAGLVGRTAASGDGIQTVAMIVINDRAVYFLKRPQDFSVDEIGQLIAQGEQNAFLDLYRRSRVQLKTERAALSPEPIFNLNVNRWSAHAPGSTYFLPVQELGMMYINGLLDIFNETTGVFVVDERANYRPAGLKRFARSRGGHLEDDPAQSRIATVRQIETLVTEFTTIEAGMMLQNLGLMSQALGLGGFPNFANHEFGWFQALGFRMGETPASQYLGLGALARLGAKLLGRDPIVPYAMGLEHEGKVLLKTYAPPYFPSMRQAVEAVVARKLRNRGTWHAQTPSGCWKDPSKTIETIPLVSEAAIEATMAYCEYLWARYGRFPAHLPPFRTVVGFQVTHLDAEFYDRFYRPEALTEPQREDFKRSRDGPRVARER